MLKENIKIDINNLMADVIGYNYGVDRNDIDAMAMQAELANKAIQANRGTGWLGWTELPYNQEAIVESILQTAKEIRERFNTFVVLGIGGSALGPIAVQQALNHMHYNELSDEKRNGPKFYVEDNIDPERMESLLDIIDIEHSCFNVISKSGKTAETMSQYLIITDALKKAVGDKWAEHIVATTDEHNGNLIKMAKENNFRLYYIPSSVGGRFSEMCPVGLLPAAVCGIDIKAMLEGAKAMDTRCKSNNLWENPALLQSVIQYIAAEYLDVNINVMMPYADSLKYIADWHCQLLGESIGKNVTRKGKAVNVGQTPVKSLGVTDQHSQLQLYTEGPYDKLITFIKVKNFRTNTSIPHGCEQYPSVSFLGGKSLNQLIEAERQGTAYALLKSGRINQTIIMPEVNAYTIGQLLYYFQMTIAYLGELYDIDAFNQPGVEESKIASYAVLGNQEPQYKAKADEMKSQVQPKSEYII